MVTRGREGRETNSDGDGDKKTNAFTVPCVETAFIIPQVGTGPNLAHRRNSAVYVNGRM